MRVRLDCTAGMRTQVEGARARSTDLCDRHSLRMKRLRLRPSEMRPATPIPRWSSILNSFRWNLPSSADVLFTDASTTCVLLWDRNGRRCQLHVAWLFQGAAQ